jgi:rSAM/selenodomain-associated transferase 1
MDDANRHNGILAATERALSGAAIRQGKPAACGIAIMAKASAPGRTKTRLVPPLTFDQAASLNTAFLRDIAGNLLTAGRHASIGGYAAYAPHGSEAFFHRTLPPEIGLIAACLPNFGDCLLHAIEAIFARGHAYAVVLNSDSPTLPTALLIETVTALAQPGERAVLGPSTDGGYYLLGLKATHRRLFEDIDWSTERVAAQTLERAREIKIDFHTLPTWYDVDDFEGLRRLHDEVRRPRPPGAQLTPHTPNFPAVTAELLRSFSAGGEITARGAAIAQAAAGEA